MTLESSDPIESAAAAGLRYVNDESPGIRRKRVGTGFSYIGADGQRMRDPRIIQRGWSDVNDYLREISASDFTAKDFRTWNGTVLAARYLKICTTPTSATAGKRLVSGAIKNVAQHLGNTPAVCRKAYVHPVVLNAYLGGSLDPEAGVSETRPARGLSDEERCVLELLQAA